MSTYGLGLRQGRFVIMSLVEGVGPFRAGAGLPFGVGRARHVVLFFVKKKVPKKSPFRQGALEAVAEISTVFQWVFCEFTFCSHALTEGPLIRPPVVQRPRQRPKNTMFKCRRMTGRHKKRLPCRRSSVIATIVTKGLSVLMKL